MTVNTITVGPGTLTIGAGGDLTNFSSQVRKCEVTPNVQTGDPLPVLSGEEVPGDRTETWTLDVTLLQDFGAAGSKVEWLFEHRGEQHPFVYAPATAADREITGTVVVEPAKIGGDVKAKATSDISMKLVGAPALGDPA